MYDPRFAREGMINIELTKLIADSAPGSIINLKEHDISLNGVRDLYRVFNTAVKGQAANKNIKFDISDSDLSTAVSMAQLFLPVNYDKPGKEYQAFVNIEKTMDRTFPKLFRAVNVLKNVDINKAFHFSAPQLKDFYSGLAGTTINAPVHIDAPELLSAAFWIESAKIKAPIKLNTPLAGVRVWHSFGPDIRGSKFEPLVETAKSVYDNILSPEAKQRADKFISDINERLAELRKQKIFFKHKAKPTDHVTVVFPRGTELPKDTANLVETLTTLARIGARVKKQSRKGFGTVVTSISNPNDNEMVDKRIGKVFETADDVKAFIDLGDYLLGKTNKLASLDARVLDIAMRTSDFPYAAAIRRMVENEEFGKLMKEKICR